MRNIALSYGPLQTIVLATLLAAACAPAGTPGPAPAPAAPGASAVAQPRAEPVSQTAGPGEQLVRVGALRSGADSGLYVAMDRGYFEQQGIAMDLTEFANSAEIIPPLSTGNLDVGGGGISSSLFNAYNRGIKLRLVADRTTYAPGTSYVSYLLRKGLETQIRTPQDLRGKTLAVNGTANSSEIDLERLLITGGLSASDVNVVQLSWPDMIPGLANGAIDVAYMAEPSATLAISQGFAVRWKGAEEFYPDHVVGVLQYSEPFVRERRDVAQRFMVAYLRGVRDYTDAFVKHRDQDSIIAILTRYTTVKDPQLWRDMQVPRIDPNGVIRRESLQYDMQWYLGRGLIQQPVPVEELIDETFARAAVAELGEYR